MSQCGAPTMNDGWLRRVHQLFACGAIASAILFASAQTAAAQAGSAGGTIGKHDKSISGGTDAEAPRAVKKQREGRDKHAPAEDHDSGSSCRSIVGKWTSWASGIYGKNDTRINADGTIVHPTSKGTWSCKGGVYTHVWAAFGVRGPYKLSPDGKRLIKIEDGSVSFSRN